MRSVVMKTQIGKVFSEILFKRGLTARQVAEATQVPASTLAEWKANRTPKNPVQVRKVAEYLGISMHYLIFGEEDREEPISKIVREDFFQGTFEITIKRVREKG